MRKLLIISAIAAAFLLSLFLASLHGSPTRADVCMDCSNNRDSIWIQCTMSSGNPTMCEQIANTWACACTCSNSCGDLPGISCNGCGNQSLVRKPWKDFFALDIQNGFICPKVISPP